ncbi:MAG: LysR family transcriptional regulator [Sutterellaceae bacterium]|nr:LysR family transcriptional regulator [Sutterellaceae bacterium]
MLFRQLRYFLSVANLASFSKAAEACFVSQSAISQQIKLLEDDLGIELIERCGRSFVLTEAGMHFKVRAEEIQRQVTQLRSEMKSFGDVAGELSVGYLSRYDGWEIQAAVAAFAVRHPKSVIRATAMSHEELYENIRQEKLDLVVSDRRRSLSPEFRNHWLFTGYESVEVSEASPLAQAETVTIKDLKGLTCILVAADERREQEEKYFREVLNFDCNFLFANSLEAARMMVAGNLGFLPLETRSGTLKTGGSVLRRIALDDDSGRMRHDYYAFWLKDRTSPRIEEFADILSELFQGE